MTVGERIRLLREQAGLTQVQLAEHAGVGIRTLIHAEHGTHSQTTRVLVKIASALGCSVADFFDGKAA